MKVAKNAFCPCGSGERYQFCCMGHMEFRAAAMLWVGIFVVVGCWALSGVGLWSIVAGFAETGNMCVPIRGTGVESCNLFFAVFKAGALAFAFLLIPRILWAVFATKFHRKRSQ